MERIKDLRDTMYLLVFAESRYATEICKILYGKENKRVFFELKKLATDGWIRAESVTVHEKDKRAEKRKYYQANNDPVIDRIKQNCKGIFDDDCQFIFSTILNAPAFRYLIKRNIPENFKETSTDSIDFILTYLDILYIISDRNELFREASRGIKTVGDYEKAIEDLQNDKKFNEKLPEIMDILFRGKEPPIQVIERMSYLFIVPSKFTFRHPGFSDFGQKYFGITSISREISKLLET